MMWPIILGMAGLGLANSVVALVEVLSAVKYVCVDSDDDMVTAAQVLDGSRAVCGFLLCVIVGYGYMRRVELSRGSKGVYYDNVAAVMLALMATLFIGVVQQSEACTNCVTDELTTFTDDTRRMLGGAACAVNFRAVHFKIPENYCRDQLQLACGTVLLPAKIYAERCLIYSCSALPHGYSFRYIYGIFGMTCQLCVCLLLLMHDGLFEEEVQHLEPRPSVPGMPSAATAPPSVTASASPLRPSAVDVPRPVPRPGNTVDILRPRRRNVGPLAYSSVNQIEF